MYSDETEILIPSDNSIRNRYQEDDDDVDESEDEVEKAYKTGSRPSRINRFIVFLICILTLVFFYIPLNMNMKPRTAAVAGWNYNTSRVTRLYVSTDQNSTLIEPLSLCDNKVLLLVFVCSATQNFDARDAIRATWKRLNYQPQFGLYHPQSEFAGKFLAPDPSFEFGDYLLQNTTKNTTSAQFNVKVVFLLGKPDPSEESLQQRILNESQQYGDIIQEDFVDSYNNLTLKSIFMLKWVTNNCLDKVKFLMKCDDDTFINIPNLIHILLGGTLPIYNATISFYDKSSVYNKVKRNRLQRKNVLTGFLFCGVRPVTDLKSKYYSPSYMYNNEFYPHYLSGTAYLMSIDVVEKLFRAALETPLFHLEDVFITGIVADRVKIKRKAHPLFYYATTKDRCAMRGMISQHQLTPPTEMYDMFDFVTNTTAHPCHGPSKKFTSSKLKLMNRRKCQ